MVAVDVLVVDHPLARSRLTVLRDERTDAGTFRFALHELTTMLVYEATREIPVERYPVRTPVDIAEGVRVANPPLLVPVLRAGLGMSDAALALLADSEGIARLDRSGLPLRLVTAAVDDRLNEKMFIVPGLGDAGDRQFGGMPRF